MVTMMEVKALLDPDEPDYAKFSELGSEAVVHLEVLADSGDEMLASKAAYAASILDDDAGADLVSRAIESESEVVRVAAAAAIRNLSSDRATALAVALSTDTDEGVGKIARQSAIAHEDSAVAAAIGATPDGSSMSGTSEAPTEGGMSSAAGKMPGEDQRPHFDVEPGMMPGETAESSQSDGSGLMPGEQPSPTG